MHQEYYFYSGEDVMASLVMEQYISPKSNPLQT